MSYNINKGETNTELVEKFMENYTPLNQAFLINAVSQYAENVVKQKDELLKQEDSAINMEAWIKCAEDWLQCCEDRK